jgi:hypothetical protein
MDGTARLCDSIHVFAVRGDQEIPRTSLHIDVDLRCWNKTHNPTTMLDVDTATLNGQALTTIGGERPFQAVTLAGGGAPEKAYFTLHAADGGALVDALPGDMLTIRFRLNRGVTRVVGPKARLALVDAEKRLPVKPRSRGMRVFRPRGRIT